MFTCLLCGGCRSGSTLLSNRGLPRAFKLSKSLSRRIPVPKIKEPTHGHFLFPAKPQALRRKHVNTMLMCGLFIGGAEYLYRVTIEEYSERITGSSYKRGVIYAYLGCFGMFELLPMWLINDRINRKDDSLLYDGFRRRSRFESASLRLEKFYKYRGGRYPLILIAPVFVGVIGAILSVGALPLDYTFYEALKCYPQVVMTTYLAATIFNSLTKAHFAVPATHGPIFALFLAGFAAQNATQSYSLSTCSIPSSEITFDVTGDKLLYIFPVVYLLAVLFRRSKMGLSPKQVYETSRWFSLQEVNAFGFLAGLVYPLVRVRNEKLVKKLEVDLEVERERLAINERLRKAKQL